MREPQFAAHAVILAGGRGTRFWPRSRARTPKQLLSIVGKQTMLQQTAERLAPLFTASRTWVVTSDQQAPAVRRQLPHLRRGQILTEPEGRNTAAAIGLAAAHLMRQSGDALMAVLPADHYIAQAARYLRLVRAALQVAARGENLVVLGIPPKRPETGYGYIERAEAASRPRARRYVASGRYYWNAGMFFWRVSTFLRNLEKFLPATYRLLMKLGDDIGTPRYARTLRRIYPQLENISVDYAILERAAQRTASRAGTARSKTASGVFVLPAEVGWSDIGSWAAVYQLMASKPGENISAGRFAALDAQGNFFWSPEKFVAAIGVRDLVVVETPDALLLCPRGRAQDVGKIVQWLEARRQNGLL
ncbi:MAG: mannose-1-phosphate guanylyltransferase [Acidobacteria bacterium]|nr:MAG: mannose-1-phosphate guanylyltransferase [Acidobacteriota bacterium]